MAEGLLIHGVNDMCPSISVSLPPNIYGRVIDYQDRHTTTLSHAAAALIKMGFAWEAETIHREKERKQRQKAQTLEEGAKAALEATIQEEAKKSKGKGKGKT